MPSRPPRLRSAPTAAAPAAPPTPAAASVKARAIALPPRATLGEACRRILAGCLEHAQANVAGVLAGDSECLHQMRVGLRRLRAALDLFGKFAPLPASLRQDLDWLAALLGKARDWDVFMTGTLDAVGGAAWRHHRQVLRDRARPLAAAAHDAVRRALRGRRYARLASALEQWLHGPSWPGQDNGAVPARLERKAGKAMRPLLARARRRLLKRLRQADRGDAASLHRVRIAAKKARYAAEFFQPLLPAGPLDRHVRRLKALQDALGRLNDFTVAQQLLAQLEHGAAAAPAAYARGYLAALAETGTAALARPLRRAGKPALAS